MPIIRGGHTLLMSNISNEIREVFCLVAPTLGGHGPCPPCVQQGMVDNVQIHLLTGTSFFLNTDFSWPVIYIDRKYHRSWKPDGLTRKGT